MKCGLETTDWVLKKKKQKKKRTLYKTRTTDCVYKNRFRKVKLRKNIPLVGYAVYSSQRQRHVEKESKLNGHFMPLFKAAENETLNFIFLEKWRGLKRI